MKEMKEAKRKKERKKEDKIITPNFNFEGNKVQGAVDNIFHKNLPLQNSKKLHRRSQR